MPASLVVVTDGARQPPVSLLDRLGAMSWHPDEYAGVRFENIHERGEWLGVAKLYRKSTLAGIAIAAGQPVWATAVPSTPGVEAVDRPGVPATASCKAA